MQKSTVSTTTLQSNIQKRRSISENGGWRIRCASGEFIRIHRRTFRTSRQRATRKRAEEKQLKTISTKSTDLEYTTATDLEQPRASELEQHTFRAYE